MTEPLSSSTSFLLAFFGPECIICAMDSYRVIANEPTDFAVEITHENGGIHITGGFRTLLAANAWMVDRLAVAKNEAAAREKLRRD